MKMKSITVWPFFNLGFVFGVFTAIVYFKEFTFRTKVSDYNEEFPSKLNFENKISNDPVLILCIVLTMPTNHETKALAAKHTWLSRCDDYYFISSQNNSNLPSIAGVIEESRDNLWDKTKYAIWWAMYKYEKPFDYFLKSDDDTYMVMENLREILHHHNKSKPFLMGRRFRPFVNQGYPSGGAGYVISRPGLKKIAECIQTNNRCGTYNYTLPEDVGFGICAENAGVPFVDSLDEDGLERFHPFPYHNMLSMRNEKSGWLANYNYYELNSGRNCCSSKSVSFHYMHPEDMYTFDFLLYQMRQKR